MRIIFFFGTFCLLFLINCGDNNAQKVATTSPSISQSFISDYQIISQAPPDNRTLENIDITLNIIGLPDGTCNLMGIFTGQFFTAATASAKNGVVRFQKETSTTPGMYYVLFPDGKTNIQVLIDKDQQFTMSSDMQDLSGLMEVEGNIETKLLYDAFRYEADLNNEFSRISQGMTQHKVGSPEHNLLIEDHKKASDKKEAYIQDIFRKHPTALFSAFKESGQNPNLKYEFNPDGSLSSKYLNDFRYQFWDNVNFQDKRLLYTPVISNKLDRFFGKVMPQNPDSIIVHAKRLVDAVINHKEYFSYFANWITLKYEPTKTPLMDPEAVYVFMVQNYFTYDRAFWSDSVQIYGLQLRATEMAGSLVGNQGPDVKAKDPNGNFKSIYEIKDDYVVVYLWNPDCEHCQEQTPKLVDFYKEWKPKGVEVYSIVVDTDDQKWKSAINKYKMPWINVYDPTNRAIYGKYYVDITPEIYVLNKNRTIIGKNLKVNQIPIMINRDKGN